jgi:glutamate synthase domain-containing protein 3
MEGFDKLTKEQQKMVLNYEENFKALSESANKSKGSKSYEEWTIYQKENIKVSPEFREEMMKKEKEVERKLQKLIDDLNGQK